MLRAPGARVRRGRGGIVSGMTPRRRGSGWLWAIPAWILLQLGCAGSDEVPSPPRHVLIVSIDTLRADFLGCYGNPTVRTPRLDALAASGLLFETHVSSAPTTLASHTSLMTGRWPHTHGVPRNGFVVPDANVTLAEVLRDAGWRTAGFIGGFPLHPRFGFAQGFEHFDAEFPPGEPGLQGTAHTRRADRVTDAVLAWLDDHPVGPDERILLFVHYFDPHAPYGAPEPYRDLYRDDDLSIRGTMRDVKRVQQALRRDPAEARTASDALRALYAGEVTYTDQRVGLLFDGLKSRGLWDELLVVVTSDHGETMHEHPAREAWGHGVEVYDTTVHTPLLLRLPGDEAAGRRLDALVSNIDVMPTLLDRLGLPIPEGVEGRSFAPLLTGDAFEPRREAFSEATRSQKQLTPEDRRWANRNKARAIRVADRKLILRPVSGERELYAPATDPHEQTDRLGESDETRALADALTRRLEAWSEGAAGGNAARDLSAESRRRLEALGYVEGHDAPDAQ